MSHKRPAKNDDPNMSGNRARNPGGLLRRVRSDKQAKHIEEQYGVELPGRSDKQLKTLMEEFGVTSQTQLLKKLKQTQH